MSTLTESVAQVPRIPEVDATFECMANVLYRAMIETPALEPADVVAISINRDWASLDSEE